MKPRSHLTIFMAVLLFASAAADVLAQRRRPARAGAVSVKAKALTPARTTPDALRRYEAFNKAWSTLADHYFDPTFNKLDWNKVKLEYEPRVRFAKSDAELHRLLSEMIARLGRSHLAIIPPEVYRAIETAKIEAKVREARRLADVGKKNSADAEDAGKTAPEDPLTQYGIGVDLRIIDGRFVITRVARASSGEKAGLKTGYVVDQINGVALTALLHRLEASGAASAPMRRQLIYQVVTGFLNGEEGSEASVTIVDESNKSRELLLKREKLDLQVISLISNIPERYLNFEKRAISDDIGYIHFDYFAVPVIDRFCDAIGEFRDKKGLVVDLRGNFGGLLATMPTFAGMLSQEKIDLGTSVYRTGAERLTALPKVKNFLGKVVFLIDNHTTSAAEIFAAAMQESGRAYLVGDRSPGEALPSVAVELPTGAVLQYPIANFKTSTGKYLEGVGVVPDYLVPLTRASLLQGKDQQLEKALELLRGDSKPLKREIAAGQSAPDFFGRISSASDTVPPPPPPNAAPSVPGPNANGRGRTSEPNVLEPAALRAIDEFLKKIGGREAVAAIDSYSMTGGTELFVKGTRNQLRIEVYRDGPSKYAEILSSPSAGEIREVHNGKTITIQSDYGLTQDIPKFTDVVDTDILGPIRTLAKTDYFSSLKYHGVFDRNGQKVHLVDGRSKDGMMIALAFDAASGLLVNFTGAYYGMTFDSYEKTGDLLLPHVIERERIMTMSIDDISVNKPIDQSKFSKKEKCYDRER